ncbi:RNA polymerase sigma factor [Fontisphaera persica]|uniref:RNA polymerase sigma factor n=1 Tax=Fontisphaera persica TaxID=2974023 RepID=UPI0024C01F04|nr:RNA polymerase sigma factor [Fontisphaera persica]WCJ60325.1 RNA polymerase sigma factor [Fontisphaera persica]
MNVSDMEVQDRADMARLVKGNRAGLNGVMDRHAPAVFRLLCGMLGDERAANDLAEETFARVYRGRASFAPKEQFRTWLFTIAVNLARQQRRARACQPNVLLSEESHSKGEGLGHTLPTGAVTLDRACGRGEAVRAAVEALPEGMHEAIVLCEWEEMTVAEAASVLQNDPRALESELGAARQFLRERLDGWL